MLAKQINSGVIFGIKATLASLFAASFIKHKLSKLKTRPLYLNTKAITAKLFAGVQNAC